MIGFFLQLLMRYAVRLSVQEVTARVISDIVSSTSHRPLDASNLPESLIDVLDESVIQDDPHVEDDVVQTEEAERDDFEGAGEDVPEDPLDQFEGEHMADPHEEEVESEDDEQKNLQSESESDDEGDVTDLDPEQEENYTIGSEEEDTRAIADGSDLGDDDDEAQFASTETGDDLFEAFGDDASADFAESIGQFMYAQATDGEDAALEPGTSESSTDLFTDLETDLLDPFGDYDDLIGDDII